MSEEQFWKAYFFLIDMLKSERQIHRIDDKLKIIAKNIARREVEKKTEIIEEMEKTKVLCAAIKETLTKIITTAKMNQKQPIDPNLDRDVDDLFNRKKKISILASESSYDEGNIELVSQIEKPFSECVRLWEEYEELKNAKRILKDETYFSPKVFGSKRGDPILNDVQRMELTRIIPYRFKNRDWDLVYSSREHGGLLNTMYSRMDDQGPFILVIENHEGEVFGAYLAALSIVDRPKYYGGGETFVWEYKDGKLLHYGWSKKNNMIILSRETSLYIGGGEDSKPALYIDEDIKRGSTGVCEPFDNPILGSQKDFKIFHIEMYSFDFKKDEKSRRNLIEIGMTQVHED
jgi:hypothetical protein